MHDLSLSVKSGSWRIFSSRKRDPGFKAFAEKVMERDDYTCQFCGFQAREYQEIVNLDHDFTRNALFNVVTACCFCTQCFFLESVGKGEYGGGSLIYLPEISQRDLNGFCHVLFCAMANGTSYQPLAQSLYRTLKFRAQVVEEQFGQRSSNPAFFGQLLLESDKLDEQTQTRLFKNLRLLPSHAKFRTQIETWAKAALSELSDKA